MNKILVKKQPILVNKGIKKHFISTYLINKSFFSSFINNRTIKFNSLLTLEKKVDYLSDKNYINKCVNTNQTRSYCLLSSKNNLKRTELLNSKKIININLEIQRNLSFDWLGKFAITQQEWFLSLSKGSCATEMMSYLQAYHDLTHLPWCASIISCTLLVKLLVTFPLTIYQVMIS